MRFPALKFIVIISFSLVFLFFNKSVSAELTQTTAVGNAEIKNEYSPNLNPDVPRDHHSYVQSTIIEIMGSMICQIAGVNMVKTDQKCLGIDPQSGKIGFVDNGGGAIGTIGTFISYTFTPPISSTQYISYLSDNFGLVKETHAQRQPSISSCASAEQGVGFCGIRPLLNIWVNMRNIAYLLFVLVFVLIGLAIMFRVHIDPRTVMTIENQIPKIIIGIIMVTFSFAIAGFLIDIMYVAIYLVGGVLAQQSPALNNPNFPTDFNQIATVPTPFDAINRLWPGDNRDDWGAGAAGGFTELANQGKLTIQALVENALNGSGSMKFEPGLLDIVGNLFTAILGMIIGLVAALVIFLALLYTAIRLWIILIVSYINILLDIVFAPFWILVGLLPGSSAGAGAWIKDMLANLAVFPTAISMLILGKVFSEIAATESSTTGSLFVPPLVGGGTGAGAEVFSGIVALGFLFMTPHVLQITKNAFKAPNINYGPVFEPASEAGGAIRGAARSAAAIQHDPLEPNPAHRKRSRIVGQLLGLGG